MIKKLYNIIKNISGKYSCPICNKKIRKFIPLPIYYKENLDKYGCSFSFDDVETLNYSAYFCPVCNSSDRDRLYALYMLKKYSSGVVRRTNMLEIAPSISLDGFLRKKVTLRTADIMMQGVDDCADIMDMHCYQENAFDAVICSHVLEHVPDDLKAIHELYRVLKPGGWGILMVPIVLSISEIDEDPLLEDVGERWRRFGQGDHLRLYSKNGFIGRVKSIGFDVQQYGKNYFSEDSFRKYGISERSILYVIEKPVMIK